MIRRMKFLCLVHATLQPALSVDPSIGQNLLLNAWLVIFITAPAPQRATWVAVYPVLFHIRIYGGCLEIAVFLAFSSHPAIVSETLSTTNPPLFRILCLYA